jgi:hypothetical protein
MKDKKKKTKRVCPICNAELDEGNCVCHDCGACLDEPCYDVEDDMDEE